jgi:hypothetical protein
MASFSQFSISLKLGIELAPRRAANCNTHTLFMVLSRTPTPAS